jgi:hypothetical protein
MGGNIIVNHPTPLEYYYNNSLKKQLSPNEFKK